MSDPAACYRDAVAAYGRGDMAHALAQSRAALQALPASAPAHALAGVAALKLGRLPEAIDHLREAESLDPSLVDYPAQLSRALLQAGETRQAADALRRAVACAPGDASLRFDFATLLTFTGELAAAADAYQACLDIEPRQWRAHLALAQARRWNADTNHVERLRSLCARHGDDPEARLYLELALARELEDLGDYPSAFAHYTAGKAAHRRRKPYDFDRDRALFDALCRVTPQPGDSPGDPSPAPVFVVGMPRTGTTLVDRILSSHPQVRSVGERYDFARALKRASGSRTPSPLDPDTIARAAAVDWARLGADYLQAVRPAVGDAVRFVDKLPHNFLYLGFIARALPNARIVCLRRERMDTALGNFRQLLSPDIPFFDYSFDLRDTGRYVLQFERLMQHWQQAFPGRILEFRYEDLVADQAQQTRRLLAYCGLPWDDACLAFERNAAAVDTASAVQVREPLHANAVGRWRRYAPQLAELKAVLAPG